MKKFSKVLSLLLVFAMIVPGIAQAATVDAEEAAVVTRISGGNRYQTAANVSNQKFGKSKTVVLASGENWPDALAGTALAGVEGAPILLTAARRLHPDTKAELISLGAEKVIIVGGETVIPAAVADELKAMGLTVDRKEGLKREDTAVAAAKGMTSKTAIIANGYESFADALSAGAYAGMNGMPILFVRQNSVPAGTLEGLKALGIENVIIAGGTSAVSAKVQSELAAYNPTRIYGEVREETSLAFAEKFENNKEVIIANGYDYADALAGAALGAKIGAPVVLVNTNSMKTVVEGFIKENADKNHTVIGGTSAVSNNVVSDIEEIIAPVESEFKVVSVSAINGKEVEIEFSKAVKKDTVIGVGEALSNIDIEEVGADSTAVGTLTGKLSEDEKTLTVSNTNVFSGKYTVNVPVTVLDKDGEAVVPYVTVIDVKDTVAPTIEKVEYKNKKVVLTFSEPIKDAPTVLRVDGVNKLTDVTVDGRTVNSAEVDIAAGKSATVYVAGAKDFAGNEMSLYNGLVAAPATNTNKPAITSVTQVDNATLRVVFNRAIDFDATNDDTELTSLPLQYRKDITSSAVPAIDVEAYTEGGAVNTYDVTFAADGLYGSADKATVTLILAKETVTAGTYKNDAYSQSFTFNADKTAPKYVSNKVDDTNKAVVDFTFDDNLTVVDGKTITVISADSVKLDAPTGYAVKAASGADAKVLRVTMGSVLTEGTYTFSFPAGIVKDANGNASAAFSATVTVGAEKPVAYAPTFTVNGETANVFKVKIAEAATGSKVFGQSAVNLANYKLDGKALPAGTTAYFNTGKTEVTITLPEGSVNINGPAVLTVSNVADKDGNVAKTANFTVTLADNIKPTIVGTPVHNATAKTISYTFSEAIQLTGKTDGTKVEFAKEHFGVYKVTDGDYKSTDKVGTVTNVVYDETSNTLTVTYSDTLEAGTYIVDAWDHNITDATGNRIANLDDATNYLITVK